MSKMSEVSEISVEEIRNYLIQHGGKVSNRELVKHFKKYLTDPNSKDDARIKFKEYVNQLATTKTENNEKFVTIRKRYVTSNPTSAPTSPTAVMSPPRQPPPYRQPPEVKSPTSFTEGDDASLDNMSQCSEYSLRSNLTLLESQSENVPPQAPPRRKSQEKLKAFQDENSNVESLDSELGIKPMESSDTEQKVSVRERTQKFNRLASETDSKPVVVSPSGLTKKKSDKVDAEDEDGVSVTSIDGKTREWVVKAAKGDYQGLAKLALENPRLVRYKDSFAGYTALHWAAKHGNENIVKLLAGKHRADVNVRTNGGYTALHIATQNGHTHIAELLRCVYNADSTLRDWSGRLPSSYVRTTNQSVSNETYRKIKARRKQSEKDTGFLRIGSLNVRVKKTTEAFSNFLSGNTGNFPTNYGDHVDKVHKSWGSADNIQEKMMPPPKGQLKKRKSKRDQMQGFSHSTPGTPNQRRSVLDKRSSDCRDSDSDNACGFDSNWHTTLDT